MRGLNLLRPSEIRNRPRQFQYAMKSPRTHAELVHRAAHQRFAGVVQLAVFADVRGTHVGVARQPRSIEARELPFARRQHALPHGLARLARTIRREFFVIDARHVHVNIEAIEQRAADSLLIACVSIAPCLRPCGRVLGNFTSGQHDRQAITGAASTAIQKEPFLLARSLAAAMPSDRICVRLAERMSYVVLLIYTARKLQ
jgi:hypothetical protein